MATYYRWRKSTVNYTKYEVNTSESRTVSQTAVQILDAGYEPQISSGNFILPSAHVTTVELTVDDDYGILGQYFMPGNSATSNVVYYANEYVDAQYVHTSKNVTYYGSTTQYGLRASPGTSQGYVYSTSSSAYPNGGVQDGYYYDQRTTVTSPTAPTGLTYPNPITTPTVTVSWSAATSATNYPVDHYQLSASYNNSPNILFSEDNIIGTSKQITIPTTYNGTPITSVSFILYAVDSNNQRSSPASSPFINVYFAPTLTVPQMVMQGQSATISWSAIEGADSYTLQRKSNTDADWTQVYSGANLSYSETVGTWTSVQYRVQAVFSGNPGGWAESAAIPVVSSSALVISGTDGDLGTVVNDIPYSISTDTGNQITATITVNSAVIFSGNVGNSTSDTIPVLDLVNGEGTIVIEASVTASGGPVSAVRTWTYTKSLITFPNAGSVAQLTKEGENIFPKTLAECVRLPGGKTLDEVTAFPCQVYTGSYVGTGTSGASNPNTLTFPFEPKIVIVTAAYDFIMIRPNQNHFLEVADNNYNNQITWNGNSVSWYCDRTPSGSIGQSNQNNLNYYYIAIG